MHRARLALFEAFHRRREVEFRSELVALAGYWTDDMLRLSPIEVSRLQRISLGQDPILQHMFREPAKMTSWGPPLVRPRSAYPCY